MKKKAASSPPAPPSPEVIASVFLGVLAVGLLWVASAQRNALNTDAIAYLQLADHYANGRWGLAVSGYWGPLWSWLAAILLKLGLEPLMAGRLIMAGSGLAFTAACFHLGRTLGFSSGGRLTLGILSGLMSLGWSGAYLTPDLLMSALGVWATSLLWRRLWSPESAPQGPVPYGLGGLAWGFAYLAKAVALPAAFLIGAVSILLSKWSDQRPWKEAGLRFVGFLAGVALPALPWILTLSLHYGQPVFSTSGAINHAIVGPSQGRQLHYFGSEIAPPQEGRITTWEEPDPRRYTFWSPLDSKEAFQHQLGLIRKHIGVALQLLATTDLIRLTLLGLLMAAICLPKPRLRIQQEKWRWGLVPVLLFLGLYLPVYLELMDDRYFYVTYPFLVAMSWGFMTYGTERVRDAFKPKVRRWAQGAVILSFGYMAFIPAWVALQPIPYRASESARILARLLEQAGVQGSIAGSGSIDYQRAGLYTAWFAHRPWIGDNPAATPSDFLSKGAELVILSRQNQPDQIQAFTAHPAWVDLDPRLFQSPDIAQTFPLKVYQRIQPGWGP